jgi:hypothetical protein
MAMNENLKSDEIHRKSNRSFGIVFAIVFLLIALFPLLNVDEIFIWSLVISAFFLISAFVYPSLLGLLNSVWLAFGNLLHRLISPIVLGGIFFLIISPFGIGMKIFSKDPLSRQIDPTKKSYWIYREPAGPTRESLKDQF